MTPDYSSRAESIAKKLILLVILAVLFSIASSAERGYLHLLDLPGAVLQQVMGASR